MQEVGFGGRWSFAPGSGCNWCIGDGSRIFIIAVEEEARHVWWRRQGSVVLGNWLSVFCSCSLELLVVARDGFAVFVLKRVGDAGLAFGVGFALFDLHWTCGSWCELVPVFVCFFVEDVITFLEGLVIRLAVVGFGDFVGACLRFRTDGFMDMLDLALHG